MQRQAEAAYFSRLPRQERYVMFFPKKISKNQYDDIKVLKEFAFLPTEVDYISGYTEGTVWLEKYDAIVKCYGNWWHVEMKVRSGNGRLAALDYVRKHGGRLINEG